ncbi:unnamed protein product [Rhizoctonia solani]|uniref:Uncharacterized protein n=1 Tax=Rhizoctonia solani TaxID=456999 RepID=A0A8H2WGL3_9AGAM|nr:unnamed protein product [Rhizoctonia solani]
MDDQFVAFLRSVSESRISPSGAVPRSYASHDGFLVEVKAIRSEYITMRFTAPDGRAVIALIPRELWGADDSASNLVAEDVRRCVIRVIRASKDRQMGVRVTNSRSANVSGDDYGDGHGEYSRLYPVTELEKRGGFPLTCRIKLRQSSKTSWSPISFAGF